MFRTVMYWPSENIEFHLIRKCKQVIAQKQVREHSALGSLLWCLQAERSRSSHVIQITLIKLPHLSIPAPS